MKYLILFLFISCGTPSAIDLSHGEWEQLMDEYDLEIYARYNGKYFYFKFVNNSDIHRKCVFDVKRTYQNNRSLAKNRQLTLPPLSTDYHRVSIPTKDTICRLENVRIINYK